MAVRGGGRRRRCRALAALTQLSRLRAADSPPGRGSAPVGPLSYCSAVHNLINILYILRRPAFDPRTSVSRRRERGPLRGAADCTVSPTRRERAAPGRFRRHANAPPNRHRIPLATTTRNAPRASDQNLLGLRPRGKEKDEPSFAFPPACGAGAESSCRQSRSPRPRDVSISSSSSLRTHSGPLRSHLVLSDLLSSSQKSFASALSCSLMRSRSAFRW
jgi:hypothetical protein